jgi:hypothetical protein
LCVCMLQALPSNGCYLQSPLSNGFIHHNMQYTIVNAALHRLLFKHHLFQVSFILYMFRPYGAIIRYTWIVKLLHWIVILHFAWHVKVYSFWKTRLDPCYNNLKKYVLCIFLIFFLVFHLLLRPVVGSYVYISCIPHTQARTNARARARTHTHTHTHYTTSHYSIQNKKTSNKHTHCCQQHTATNETQ